MIAAGLPVAKGIEIYTADDDPNHLLGRQGGYTSKIDMHDYRFPVAVAVGDTTGQTSIECYPSKAGASTRLNYLQGFSGGPFGDGYDYLSGDCLLRVDRSMTPPQTAQYQALFEQSS